MQFKILKMKFSPGIVRTTIIHKQGVTSEVMEQAEQFILSDKDFLPSRTIGLPEDIAKAIAFLADRSMGFKINFSIFDVLPFHSE